MYICIYVCKCIYTYTFINMYIYKPEGLYCHKYLWDCTARVDARAKTPVTRKKLYEYIYTHVPFYLFVCIYLSKYMYTHVHTCIHTYIYTYIYIYTFCSEEAYPCQTTCHALNI